MIITEVNSFVDLVVKATNFAAELQDGWFKGSAEVDTFQDQVLMLCEKHDQWSAQLRRHGLSEDKRLLLAVHAAVQVLDKQQQYVTRLQKNRLLRWRRKAFPGQLSYTLNRVLAIVDAGPQLLAGRVATHELLERSGGQTPAPLPFVRDPNYVPVSQSITEIQKALGREEGLRVVTVYGGPGLGKSSVVKYLALQYVEERKQWLKGTPSTTPTFPDGVYYLFCGQGARGRVQQLQAELTECLGFGAPPNDSMVAGAQEGQYFQQPSLQIKLRSRLVEQKLLIILDDLWEGEVLEQLLVPANGVKYLITSQRKDIWGAAEKIQLENPTISEATRITANYTDGLPTKGEFPHSIQDVTDDIIRKLDYHPLSLANVGMRINRSRVTDVSHWKAIRENILVVLDENDLQDSPVIYERRYKLPVSASMMLMVESLDPEPRRLLFLMALLEGELLPESLVRFFYKMLQAVQTPGFLLQYNNQEKYLEDRSLVALHMRENEATLAVHNLRMQYIREKKTLDLHSIASQVLPECNQGVELIQNGDAEETLVTVLSAMYYREPFKDVVLNTLERHLRIINDGVVPRNINCGIDALQLVKARRDEVEDLVFLLDVDHGEADWKRQAHGYAIKIIIKLACQGKLDDDSMACLLQLPQTTSKACAALLAILWWMECVSNYSNDTFSSVCPTTMKTLLALVYDNATSTTRGGAAVRLLLRVLDFESKDNVVKVATKLTELLAMDSNPTLQIAIADGISFSLGAKSGSMILECTEILEVLMGLLVSGKDPNLRVAAGNALFLFLLSFGPCLWTPVALKIAFIQDALANLFALFLSKETFHGSSFIAGHILGSLISCVLENICKFRAMKDSLQGLGDILATMEGTWRATHKQEDRKNLEHHAFIAAGILGQLALDKELKEIIVLLPRIKETLLFLQVVEMARLGTRDPWDQTHFNHWVMSTRALTTLFSNLANPGSRGIPSIGELEIFIHDNGLPSKISFMANTHVSVYWTQVLVHVETGAYRAALENLENLDLAQPHLTQISDGKNVFIISRPWWRHPWWTKPTLIFWSDTALALSYIRISLLAMLEDHQGTLLVANTMVEKYPQKQEALIQRAVVKRLAGDFKGALDDLNLALVAKEYNKSAILAHRGYVKHLMEDDKGARQDAEAAQHLKFQYPEFTKAVNFERSWLLYKQPINYLGYSFFSGREKTTSWK